MVSGRCARRPGFIRIRAKAVLLVLIFGVFLLLSIVSSSVVGFMSGASAELVSILAVVIGLVFAIGMFLVVYKSPQTRRLLGAPLSFLLYSPESSGPSQKSCTGLYLTHLGKLQQCLRLAWRRGDTCNVDLLLLDDPGLGAQLGYIREHGTDDEGAHRGPGYGRRRNRSSLLDELPMSLRSVFTPSSGERS